jgi:hypothetical protein
MSWCDKLASMPGIGITLNWHHVSSQTLLDAFAPLIDRYVDGNEIKATLEVGEPNVAGFITNEGFHYTAEPSKVFVNFQHRMRAKAMSAGPPVMEMLSRPAPFTELLPECSARLIEATLLLPSADKRKIKRLGVVATTVVAEDQLPPGISRFLTYVGRPWKNLGDYSISITTELGQSAHGTDKCIHNLIKKESEEGLVTLVFDWQRWLSSDHAVSASSLKTLLTNGETSALQYFEELAEGSIFDEDVILSST